MKKSLIIMIAIILILGIGIWWFLGKNKKQESQSNYQAEKSSTNVNVEEQTKKDNTANQVNTQTEESKNETKITTENKNNVATPISTNDNKKTETEIATFSTKIYNKDSERQNNISITCNSLNNKEIKPGETFSFCNTVGKATTSKGYQEADIYVEGKKEQGLGGGNCQVSTTLYNAVIKIPELEVVERHQHSGNVPYIEDGKDAAVAYGSYDFKFKNNTGSTIKIVMQKTSDTITAKLLKIS